MVLRMDFEVADRFWGRRVPNHRLTSGILPPPDASGEQLLHFSGTFDGYSVRRDLRTYLPDVFFPWFQSHRRLPELSLTMARALLFGFGRWHHHGGGFGTLENSEWMPCLRALTERIRELVHAREAGLPAELGSRTAIEDGLIDAYERTLDEYSRWGGYRFHGWTNFPDTHNFLGPVVWSENDCVLRFAVELERDFPRAVHTEFAIGKASRLDYDPDVERRQRVDLVVSNLAGFVEDETAQERFQTMTHDAFVEVKWLKKGWRGQRYEQDATTRTASVYEDIAKLRRHLELSRCRVAAVLVFDDEDYFVESLAPEDDQRLGTPATRGPLEEVPGPVWRLIIGPEALRERGLLLPEVPPNA